MFRLKSKGSNNDANTEKMLRQEITKRDLHVKSCIKDIQNCCGDQQELTTLNLEAGESVRALKKAIDDLKSLAMEQDKEQDRKRVLACVDQHTIAMKTNTEALRKANLTAQREIQKQCHKDLLSGGSSALQKSRADKESLIRGTSSMTENLFSISRMMATQVKHSEDTLERLVGTSTTITESHEETRNMSGAIFQSRKLLTKYGRREMTDRVLILLAITFFFACVLYVLKRRLF
uniref:Putative vesicle transport protein sec20 n=1 Tax=Ornithodoros turicata TaxID=34597 RepID=A0A2R5LIA8_9ACAR